MSRAVADGVMLPGRFSDPIAIQVLPAPLREKVEAIRRREPPRGLRSRFGRFYLERQAKMMVARTVGIDDAIREVKPPQVVILGAGLDGRAWRMTELTASVVFEVDHPDSQRDKRARTAPLTLAAREVRFVPVDFLKDPLDRALSDAGHDPAQPTVWIWEGVVMYLALNDIEATLSVISQRSAPGSRLVVNYHAPFLIRRLLGLGVGLIGEPLRSAFRPDQMRALLAKYRFEVRRDDDLAAMALAYSPELGRGMERIRHARLAIADLPAR